MLPLAGCSPSGFDEAPDYHARALSGSKFTKASLKGKVVLVQLWATWCGYCRREQPVLDELVRQFAPKGLTLLAVNVGESRDTVEQYLREMPREPHVVLENDTNLAKFYNSGGFPAYVLIDREGKLAGAQRGAGGEEALRELLSRAGIS